jgi:hypothetical protein
LLRRAAAIKHPRQPSLVYEQKKNSCNHYLLGANAITAGISASYHRLATARRTKRSDNGINTGH